MQLLADIVSTIIILLTMLMLATAMVNLFFRVPFVPSKMASVKKMVKIAKLKKNEVVYDLGCGDARLLIEAKKKQNIEAKGFETAPIPFLLANLQKWYQNSKIKLYFSNFFKANLKDADVIFCYLGPEVMNQLYVKFKKECKKGTRIISNTFRISSLKPVKIWQKDEERKIPTIYVYEI